MNSHNLTCLTMITILEHESLEWLTQNTYLGIDCITQIRMIPQDLVKYSVNNWTRIYPPVYPLCPVCQLLLEVDKGWCTVTHTRWPRSRPALEDWISELLQYHCESIRTRFLTCSLKKLSRALFTIRTVLNNLSDEHAVVVVWMVSGMKELLHFPNQPFPVAIHQSICTCHQILPAMDASNA